jgi:hypothetical protein
MATLHSATLIPSKLEMLSAYLPIQSWFNGSSGSALSVLGAYRFDDPEGEVGIETHILATSTGAVIQMPLTYRSGPVTGADPWLLGTMEHSVLGRRWIYNACTELVYARELARTMLEASPQARLMVETENGPVERPPSIELTSSADPDRGVPAMESVVVTLNGSETSIRSGELELVVRHVINDDGPVEAAASLFGQWSGSEEPALLAYIR